MNSDACSALEQPGAVSSHIHSIVVGAVALVGSCDEGRLRDSSPDSDSVAAVVGGGCDGIVDACRALAGGLARCDVAVVGDDFDSVQSLQMKEGKMPVIDRIALR